MKLSSALVAGVLLTIAVPVCAQSLGDLAKKEQERRKTAPSATKTYTNDDLKKMPAPPAPEPGTVPAAKDLDKDPAKPGDAKADDRQKALAELERVKTEIEKLTKQIADIEEEARRAGVPPGWLR